MSRTVRFPPSLLDDIRARLPLSSVVGRRVQWDRRKTQPAKGDYWACCPFHSEKSPSFHADDRKGRYHCFGCGASGDHFTFLTELEGVPFPEAVERLAAEAGVALPAPDPRAEEREKRRASLYDVMEMAARFFEETLRGPAGAGARAYLQKRRLGPEAQRRYRLGYAAASRSALKEHLAGKGVTQEAMAEAGLLITGDDIPVSFDRFRDRIIFPIEDLRGRVVAFGGRAMAADAQAKYLNSPETPLFQKGSLLYRAAAAREASRTAGTIVVVEGYVDAIACAEAGIGHVVAPLGTAMTERQLELLWRMVPEPILCFDGDAAGIRAAERMTDVALPLLKPGKTLHVALLPDGQDPDDLIGDGGAEAMQRVLAGARPLVEMIWSRELSAGTLDTPERRAAFEQRLMAAARSIADPGVRRHYEQSFAERIAELFGSRFPASGQRRGRRGASRGGGRGLPNPRPWERPPITISETLRRSPILQAGPSLREAVLVMTMVNHPHLLGEHFDAFCTVELTFPALDRLRTEALEIVAGNPALDATGLRDALAAAGQQALLARLEGMVERSGHWQAMAAADDRDAEQGWLQAVTLHRKARTLHKELKDAEAALAVDPSEVNLARMVDIQQQLSSADNIDAAIEGFGLYSGRHARSV